MFLVGFCSVAGAVEDPAERGFYPGHAIGFEGWDGEGLGGNGGGGYCFVVGLVDCYCCWGVGGADLVVGRGGGSGGGGFGTHFPGPRFEFCV